MLGVNSKSYYYIFNVHCRIGVSILAFVLPLIFTMFLIRAAHADLEASSVNITVCPDGPPACDFATIQAGIDAAEAGDTILIGSGVYTENLTLRSEIWIESVDGPESAVVTAHQGPIISGNAVNSVYLNGLVISGMYTVFTTTGIVLQDSEVTLSDMIISDFAGYPGNEFNPDGNDAFGVRSMGAVSLTVLNSHIQNLAAGGGWSGGDTGHEGGDAAGVWVNGEGQVNIISTAIDSLSGGAAGSYEPWPYGCEGSGGSALGIHVEGGADLTVTSSEITNLIAGSPCYASAGCYERAGSFAGIEAEEGKVVLSRNNIGGNHLAPSYGGESGYGIRSTGSEGTYLDQNTIQGIFGTRDTVKGITPYQMNSPWCPEPGGDVTGVASVGDEILWMTSNTIVGLYSSGTGGRTTGLLVQDASYAKISHNTIDSLAGGYSGLTAIGAYIRELSAVEIEANSISNLTGAPGPQQVYYLSGGFSGGSSVGIYLENVSDTSAFNNKIVSLAGGDAGNPGASNRPGPYGGDAIAMIVSQSSARIVNNTIHLTKAGDGSQQGEPPGEPGIAVGLLASYGAEVATFNNVIQDNGIGILSNPSGLLTSNYNDLWANTLDYEGVLPGAHDTHVAPGWADSQFHLGPDSPLIDAGTNLGAPHEDYDGDPRPVDGDGDGTAIADIGADEFCLGICFTSKSANPHIVSAGDTITYTISVKNSQFAPFIGVLSMIDALSPLTQYVEGSLSASSGTANYIDGTISWTGTIPAGGTFTMFFRVSTDPTLEGPYAVLNEAELSDGGGMSRQMRTVILVDPHQTVLPRVSMSR